MLKNNNCLMVTLFLLIIPNYCVLNANENTTVGNEKWKIKLEKVEPCKTCLANQAFYLNIKNLKQNTSYQWVLKNNTKNIIKLNIYADKLIVLGELPNLGDIITIYDLTNMAMIDEFYGYSFSMSPNGRYALFQKYYPRFMPKELISDVVLIYDFKKSPIENRVQDQKEKNDPENRGIPIFPKYNIDKKTVAPNLEINKINIGIYQVWSEDGDECTFFATDFKMNTKMLVVIDIGMETVHVSIVHINEKANENGNFIIPTKIEGSKIKFN